MSKCCSSNDENECCDVTVKVNVDVPKIVRCLCVTGVLIVGIIFGTKTFQKMLDSGFFDIEE
jgi:hypothetical protein